MLGEILDLSGGEFSEIRDVWKEGAAQTADQLYNYILEQQRSGAIFETNHPPSYWRNGFYSAALKAYRDFLVENSHVAKLEEIYDKGEKYNPEAFEIPLEDAKFIVGDAGGSRGEDIIREVKVRAGQEAFARNIKRNYKFACCVTGLDAPQLNDACHIIPWRDREDTRLDPRNGLCLSGTYHKAFDNYLISFDDNFCLVVSSDLRDRFTKEVFREYFERFEGLAIALPKREPPSTAYLREHRKRMS